MAPISRAQAENGLLTEKLPTDLADDIKTGPRVNKAEDIVDVVAGSQATRIMTANSAKMDIGVLVAKFVEEEKVNMS
ncbi:hypothetical protein TorRG33x02_094520 [Trema orientale]|uniref:Uncharacterized protein n=1 Tax=Trema orientale TaxID=63057 RepID=A0A2P5FA52_TREOI|nr:hypothetical protein TorRG33x02_094520 [Trema orientale]